MHVVSNPNKVWFSCLGHWSVFNFTSPHHSGTTRDEARLSWGDGWTEKRDPFQLCIINSADIKELFILFLTQLCPTNLQRLAMLVAHTYNHKNKGNVWWLVGNKYEQPTSIGNYMERKMSSCESEIKCFSHQGR